MLNSCDEIIEKIFKKKTYLLRNCLFFFLVQEIVCLNENREEIMDNFEGKKDINHSRRFHCYVLCSSFSSSALRFLQCYRNETSQQFKPC